MTSSNKVDRLAAAFCLLTFFAMSGARGESQQPNLIVILTDDQASWTVGAYGNQEVSTPNIDAIAADGGRFSNAFVSTPVCSPSRATFLTGLEGTRMGITDYISRGPKFESQAGLGIPNELTTWPELLQHNGYTTGLFGKWHLGELPEFHPTNNGFDHFFGFLGPGSRTYDAVLEENGVEIQSEGYLGDVLFDESIEFISKNRSQPFALVLSTRAPHLPFGPVPQEDSAVYEGLDPTVPIAPGADVALIKKLTIEYYSSVRSIDRNVGRLLEALEKQDLLEKTIVVYTSDHGYMIGHHGLQEKGNAWWLAGGVRGPFRPNMFEEAVRVPLLIRWPGHVEAGAVYDEFVGNIDLYSSLMGMLGISVPDNIEQDGEDFSPLLRGEDIPWRDAIYGQYDMHNFDLAFMRMIRTPKWKLVRKYFTNNLDELYDLENDPEEQENLHYKGRFQLNPEYSDTIESLNKELLQWQRSIDDPILRPELFELEPVNRRLERRLLDEAH